MRNFSQSIRSILVLAALSCSESATLNPSSELANSASSYVTPKNIDTNYIQGKFNPNKNPDFKEVSRQMSVRSGIYLRHETLDAFTKMQAAAQKAGITLKIVSGARNFNSQKSIWDAKYTGTRRSGGEDMRKYKEGDERVLAILQYSSMPGTSRHHWGTDIDLSFDGSANLDNISWDQGKGKKAYQWLEKNATGFGFCQPYKNRPKDRRDGFKHGYEQEKWHWSYTPIAIPLLKYVEGDTNFTPSGFKADTVAAKYARDYMLNVDHTCLK